MGIDYNVILGCPRSGTTFLLDSLQALPKTECISGHLIPIIIPHLVNQELSEQTYQALSNSVEFSLIDFLECIEKNRFSAIQKWLSQSMETLELVEALQRKRPIQRIIYKEPFLGFSPEFIYNSLPDCRIVHIYRDGRDCADSLVRKYNVLTDEKLMNLNAAESPIGRKVDHRYVPWWVEHGFEQDFLESTPYVRAIWMWKEVVRRCHTYFSKPDVASTNRVMLLRYEDLAREPAKFAEEIVAHFGCRLNRKLENKFKQARTSSISIYKRRDPEEISRAEKIAGTELSLYGYL